MRKKPLSLMGVGLIIALLTMLSVPVGATPITFSGAGINTITGQAISASATFDLIQKDLVTNLLQVTLTNTGGEVLAPSDILTALFFDITGNPLLSRISASLAEGSSVLFGKTDPNDVVGGEWAYTNKASSTPDGAREGISSTGLGISYSGKFPGSNLQGPKSVDGLQYGITSGIDNPATGNAAVTGGFALIQNSVVFQLGSLPNGFTLDQISNVQFQYGTAWNEPSLPGNPVPEPATMLLLGSGLIAIAGFGRKKFKKQLTA